MRNVVVITLLILACVLLAACKEAPPPPPPTPPPPPDPTPEEVAAEIRPNFQPLAVLLQDTGAGKGFGDGGHGAATGLQSAVKEQVLTSLRTARAKHQVTEYGKAGLAIATHELEGIISGARDQQRWPLVIASIEAFEILDPGNSKMNRLKERAALHIKRPLVFVKGYFEDKETGETYVFLDLMLKPSMEHVTVKARKGEEFHNVRLLDIYGNNKGVELEYMLIPGETWVVTGP